MQVELVYEKTCPNIQAARDQLLKAFTEAQQAPVWTEWDVDAADAPEHIHGYGSPTILVNGQDVSGSMEQGHDYCCRVYANTDSQNKGIPSLQDIVSALRAGKKKSKAKSLWRSANWSMLPAIGVAVLPKVFCPACWPAYAGLLSALGLGFFDYTAFLLPSTIIFLLIALVALSFRAKQRRGYGPLAVGVIAAALILAGKFYFSSDASMYVGLVFLVAASLWNTWPKKEVAACPACG